MAALLGALITVALAQEPLRSGDNRPIACVFIASLIPATRHLYAGFRPRLTDLESVRPGGPRAG